uniref:Uncharacterized protein n=1 Tax=Arundo donax TaxID=35708 RepID=A0A0A9DUX5_ARUDO
MCRVKVYYCKKGLRCELFLCTTTVSFFLFSPFPASFSIFKIRDVNVKYISLGKLPSFFSRGLEWCSILV